MKSPRLPALSPRAEIALVVGITLLAFLLRTVGHWYAPPGWRDDELSNALVVSQHVLDGEVRLYYDDASGHEGLYHWLQAGTMALFGPGVWGIRGVSILLGTLAVPLLYLLARRMFGWPVAAISALALALSFWSLMYSRSGQRHISVTVTTLLGFYFLWKALPARAADGSPDEGRGRMRWFLLAGVAIGVGFYTYFASRGVPLIVLAWGGILLIRDRALWRAARGGLLVMLLVAGVLSVPLIVTLVRQPEAEARVAELAKPIYDARQGDFSTLGRYALTTLSMFTHDGDDEALYNVPHRPVFGPPGAALFWGGVLLALARTLGPPRDARHAFLLLWLGAGLAPGALSVPAASLGHTLLAQPVAMIFPALALVGAGEWLAARWPDRRALVALLAAGLVFLGWEGMRTVRDYWFVWPRHPFTRVLHHSDLHEAARWLNDHAGTRNIAIGGFLSERWDQQVMRLDLKGEGWQVRAFDPREAYLLIPEGGIVVVPEYLRGSWGVNRFGEELGVSTPYALRQIEAPPGSPADDELALFDNGLALLRAEVGEVAADGDPLVVLTHWRAAQPLELPPFPLLSKPPAP
ncbi:MAG TPA: phospholipid carrier-dependent glycosyltransferase, partial [Chloroflexi bacterium]|nr:phospholipid carrier-dependent glycosyltransferase [Chloroflexota bacterium]